MPHMDLAQGIFLKTTSWQQQILTQNFQLKSEGNFLVKREKEAS